MMDLRMGFLYPGFCHSLQLAPNRTNTGGSVLRYVLEVPKARTRRTSSRRSLRYRRMMAHRIRVELSHIPRGLSTKDFNIRLELAVPLELLGQALRRGVEEDIPAPETELVPVWAAKGWHALEGACLAVEDFWGIVCSILAGITQSNRKDNYDNVLDVFDSSSESEVEDIEREPFEITFRTPFAPLTQEVRELEEEFVASEVERRRSETSLHTTKSNKDDDNDAEVEDVLPLPACSYRPILTSNATIIPPDSTHPFWTRACRVCGKDCGSFQLLAEHLCVARHFSNEAAAETEQLTPVLEVYPDTYLPNTAEPEPQIRGANNTMAVLKYSTPENIHHSSARDPSGRRGSWIHRRISSLPTKLLHSQQQQQQQQKHSEETEDKPRLRKRSSSTSVKGLFRQIRTKVGGDRAMTSKVTRA